MIEWDAIFDYCAGSGRGFSPKIDDKSALLKNLTTYQTTMKVTDFRQIFRGPPNFAHFYTAKRLNRRKTSARYTGWDMG